jgi:hypothetical protein
MELKEADFDQPGRMRHGLVSIMGMGAVARLSRGWTRADSGFASSAFGWSNRSINRP